MRISRVVRGGKSGTRPGRYELPSDEHRHRRARDLYEAVSRIPPDPPRPKCDAPAGSPCRTGGGKTAAWYHTARFILVPALREELNVVVPPDRAPGRPWGLTHNGTVTGVSEPSRYGAPTSR